ncbi:hypothetical protein Clacol_005320 [Clathrus columnatus]|uniref:C2H2-type domain-containing protein n=1 Tax=Clathrus columnatus TaxID=1419009 RepID=A0AAV5AD28_9AGAM|nr:hypothetical protein Clacol_005320 [Clathrus columnatus]
MDVTEKDEQGFLKDLANLEEITDAQIPQEKVKQTADLNAFFLPPFRDEKNKQRRRCIICGTNIINEITTCQHHLEAKHVGKYSDWVKNTLVSYTKLNKVVVQDLGSKISQALPQKILVERDRW